MRSRWLRPGVLIVVAVLVCLLAWWVRGLSPGVNRLRERLMQVADCPLPSDAKVVRSSRKPAFLDPSEFYEVELDPASASAVIEKVRAASKSPHRFPLDARTSLGSEVLPDWWAKACDPSLAEGVGHREGGGCLFVMPSADHKRVWVCYLDT